MDIAVFSDIHGNYIALERCLSYALERNINTFIFLGDYLGEFAYPQRTMQIIYDLSTRYQCYFIKGNKEDYWLNYRGSGEQGWKDYNSTTGCLLYVYRKLKNRDFEFFSSLPIMQVLTIDHHEPITICHGSPFNVKQKLLPNDEQTLEIIEQCRTNIILAGHTHIQRKIVNGNRIVLNPGSVGCSLKSNGLAQFMILHMKEELIKEEFISLDYDKDRVMRELDEEQLNLHAPFWIKVTKAVVEGKNCSQGTVLKKAMDLCRKANGECNWPDIPERYWEEAWAIFTKS